MFIKYCFNNKKNAQGFTLIELLIVLAIISILIFIIIVYLDPVKRISEAKDVRRSLDIEAITLAVTLYLYDFNELPTNFDSLEPNKRYMLSYTSDFPDNPRCNLNCPMVEASTDCLNTYGSTLFSEEYLKRLPVSPPSGRIIWNEVYSGYYIYISPKQRVTVGYCGDGSLEVTR